MAGIRTTHTGSLPRPEELVEMIVQHDQGAEFPDLEQRIASAVGDVVRQQAEIGLDLVGDGEQGKTGYSTYVKDRLTGFEGESPPFGNLPELTDHPDYAQRLAALAGGVYVNTPACTGPVRLRDPEAIRRDIDDLLRAADEAGVERERLFMTAASPGVIAFFFTDEFYGDREEYLADLAAAMRPSRRRGSRSSSTAPTWPWRVTSSSPIEAWGSSVARSRSTSRR
jgi:5-methyltetrahydropteroyltriglutamate--homocysteine methyltransferase